MDIPTQPQLRLVVQPWRLAQLQTFISKHIRCLAMVLQGTRHGGLWWHHRAQQHLQVLYHQSLYRQLQVQFQIPDLCQVQVKCHQRALRHFLRGPISNHHQVIHRQHNFPRPTPFPMIKGNLLRRISRIQILSGNRLLST